MADQNDIDSRFVPCISAPGTLWNTQQISDGNDYLIVEALRLYQASQSPRDLVKTHFWALPPESRFNVLG